MTGSKEKKALSYIVVFLIVYATILAVDEVLNPSIERRGLRDDDNVSPLDDYDASSLDPKLTRGKSWEDNSILQDGTYLIFEDEFKLGDYCQMSPRKRRRIKRIHLHAGSCKRFDSQFGNRLGSLYGIKSIGNAMQVPTYFTCDVEEGETPNGAAYLMELNAFAKDVGPRPTNAKGKELTVEQVCKSCGNTFCNWHDGFLYLASESMISDWKRLSDPTVVSVDDHDDAVIHLRLGDALVARRGNNEQKGVFPHQTYIDLLMNAQREKGRIRSIGVVTAPFKGNFVRSGYDVGSTDRSEIVARDLIDALQFAFPRATIRLLNSPKQTIMESLVRLVKADKVAICGCSTFCPYPVMATTGIGYVYNPLRNQNVWVKNAAMRYDNYRLFDTPMLNMLAMENVVTQTKLDDADLLAWMRSQSPAVGNIDITENPIIRLPPEEECSATEFGTKKKLSKPRLRQISLQSQLSSRQLLDTLHLDSNLKHIVWDSNAAFELEKIIASGCSLSSPDHSHAAEDVILALQQTGTDIPKSSVAVVSRAVSPWVEYILKYSGASRVTSIDYNEPIVCGIDWIEPKSVAAFDSEEAKYNLIVSYSAFEQFGLKSLNGPRISNEDLNMITRMHKALVPGGFLLLAVPTSSESYTVNGLYRVYNSERLALLFRHRFEFVGRVWDGQVHGGWTDVHLGSRLFPNPDWLEVDWKHRQVLVLRKET